MERKEQRCEELVGRVLGLVIQSIQEVSKREEYSLTPCFWLQPRGDTSTEMWRRRKREYGTCEGERMG